MQRFRRTLCAALGIVALGLAGTPALAQQKYSLKFNHVLGPKEPYHEGFLKWAKAVEERTKGGLKIDVFHSAQLGREEDIIEQIRQGANIGQNTDSARMGNYVPGIAVMNGPYFAETLEEVAKLRKAPTVVKWQDELASHRQHFPVAQGSGGRRQEGGHFPVGVAVLHDVLDQHAVLRFGQFGAADFPAQRLHAFG